MKSVLIIGLGKFGMHMAEKFIEQGHEVMAIDCVEARADGAADFIQNIIIGDARDERFMKGIGVGDFDLAVIAIGDQFQTTLEITVVLKDLGCKYIIARASSDVHKKLLLRNGADYVSYAEREVAERLAIRYAADNVFDFIELTPEIGIYEIAIPRIWQGKSIIDLNIRNTYKVSILAIKANGKIYPLPDAHYVFRENDNIMVMGSLEDIEKINKAGTVKDRKKKK